jgi:ubiquitin-protein ligase
MESIVLLGRQRLMRDIKELVDNPYPNIVLRPRDDNIKFACLILSPENYHTLHLSINFPDEYPRNPPRIKMNSTIQHPNVYGSFICASVLNAYDDYSPAYTVKSIAIQMLSFFGSDYLEQSDWDGFVDLQQYRVDNMALEGCVDYVCEHCAFGGVVAVSRKVPAHPKAIPGASYLDKDAASSLSRPRRRRRRAATRNEVVLTERPSTASSEPVPSTPAIGNRAISPA